jgi:transposase
MIEREAEKTPDAEAQVSLNPLAEIVADKGYHSNETMLMIEQAEARSYIPEPKQESRNWAGKTAEQKAVYANRRRVKGDYGKRLLKRRGELIERSLHTATKPELCDECICGAGKTSPNGS